MKLLMVDNYDSFTYNLVQYLGELGSEPEVIRNDAWTVDEVTRWQPDAIVLSPGPCTPTEAGISVEIVRRLSGTIPLLGVCLGHQSIGAAFGGRVVRSGVIMHGKASPVLHEGQGLFTGLPSPFVATRYHSLVIEPSSLPSCLEVTAWTEDPSGRTIMAVAHREHPTWGVQFHPESILTEHGHALLDRFLGMARTFLDGGPR